MRTAMVLDDRSLEEQASDVFHVTVDFLHDHGFLTGEQFRELSSNYAIVIRKPSFFKRLLRCLTENERDCYIIVEQKNIVINEDQVLEKPKAPTGRFIEEKDLKKGRGVIAETEGN